MTMRTHRIVSWVWALTLGCTAALRLTAEDAAPPLPGAAAAPAAAPVAVPAPVPVAEPAVASEASAPASAPAPALPAALHCGQLLRLERVTLPVAWVDVARAAAEGNLEAGTGSAETTGQRAPADGMAFAVAVFEVKSGRSLSRYDYRLEVEGKRTDCLALAVGENPFDVRRWKVASAGEVRMLFEVPAEAPAVNLVAALNLSLPLRQIKGLAFAPPVAAAPAALTPAAAATPPAAVAEATAAPAPAEPAKPAPAKPPVEKPAAAKPAAEKPAAEKPAPAKPAPEKPAPAKKVDALEF